MSDSFGHRGAPLPVQAEQTGETNRDTGHVQGVCGELIALLGEDATFILVEKFGGRRLFVPKTARGRSIVWQAIGEEKAKLLSASFGGETLKLPISRNWKIQVYHSRGMSYARIATALGIVESTVFRAIKSMSDAVRAREAERQPAPTRKIVA